MNYPIRPYDDALAEILHEGSDVRNDRTGVRCRRLEGMTRRYDLTGAFPMVTKRKVWPKSIWAELLWILSGSTNVNDLNALGSKIWDQWVDPEFEAKHGYAPGRLGPVYGFQLRHFGGAYGDGVSRKPKRPSLVDVVCDAVRLYFDPLGSIGSERTGYGQGGTDQLEAALRKLREDPSSRSNLISLWNPRDVPKQRLPCCHFAFQLLADDERNLTGALYQRSADFPVGVPANIQFYSTLTIMFAQLAGFKPHRLVHQTGDSHIYHDQIDAVEEYLSRPETPCPILQVRDASGFEDYTPDHFELTGYEPQPVIKIPVAV